MQNISDAMCLQWSVVPFGMFHTRCYSCIYTCFYSCKGSIDIDSWCLYASHNTPPLLKCKL